MAMKIEDAKKIKEAVSDESKEKEQKITDLPGVGPAVAAKLESAGIYDLMSIAVMTPSDLSQIAGVSPAIARKIIQASRKMLDLGFLEGTEYAKKRESIHHITTGSKNFDALLGGRGVESRSITEAFGAYGSGKCVSKDTPVCYFNDTRMHVESIEKTYEKYKEQNGERAVEEVGFAVPVSTVKVLAWANGKLKVVRADNLYKERVKKLFLIKTKRGRLLKITGEHQILSFDNGVKWKKTKFLEAGDLIASPKEINLETENIYDEDDAYFLGLFVAEGTHNPFSITITDEKIKNWVCEYVKRKFDYYPAVRKRELDGKLPCYTILLRNNTRVIMDELDKCDSSEKFIPESVFLSTEGVITSFLGGYFDGDAEVSKEDISVTTKSEKLAVQLTYLLLRLGISASVRDRTAGPKKEKYKVVRISGEDREKLKKIKFKIKSFNPNLKNSAYNYPREIVSFISELYKVSIRGNKGNLRKIIGKRNTQVTVYQNLTNRSNANAINNKTLDKIADIFESEKNSYVEIIWKLENEKLSLRLLRDIYPILPFAFNDLAKDMGIKKSSIRNYYSRKIPGNKAEILRNLILNELKTRVDTILLALEIIHEIKMFNWDIVESAEVVDYDDYVYDFVVPEGHSFVGGNMPTMMHNTQVGLTLAVNVQLPLDQGGANGKCVFIDTEGSLPYEEIVLLEIGGKLQFRKIGEIVEDAIKNSKEKEEINGSISVAENPKKIKAISFDPENYKIGKFEITGFIKHPVKKIFRIKLASGREVKTTEYHNFFTLNENAEIAPVYLKDLKKNEFIAVPAFIPQADNFNEISLEEAEFFGLYVAEGSMIPDDRYKTGYYLAIITSKDKEAEEIVRKFCEKRGYNFHKNKLDFRIYSKELTEELKGCYEFSPYNSHTKKVPEFIFNSSSNSKKWFLNGYLLGDGSFNKINNTQNADTVSRFLASDMLYLMSSFNVPARNQQIFREGKNSRGGPSQTYNIHWVVNKSKDRNLELLPNNHLQVGNLLKKIRNESNLKQKDISISKTLASISQIETGICNSVSRIKLSKILSKIMAETPSFLKLKRIINSDIWFDQILSIEEIGEEECYDFEVFSGKKVQNFVAGYGGIFLHNTFRPSRIKQIAEKLGANPEKVLKNIFVARAFNSLPASEKVFILNDNEFHKEDIGEVVENRKDHKVLTFSFEQGTGKMKPMLITNLISHYVPKNENIYTIKTKFGREISVTGSHSLFKGIRKSKKGLGTVRREAGNMRPEVVEASSLRQGDYVAIPKFLPMIEKDIKEFSPDKLFNKFPKDIINEITMGDDSMKLVHTGRHAAHKFPKNIELDNNLLWLLGLIIAEGNSQYKNRLVRVRISSNTEFLNKAQKIIKNKFDLQTHLYEKAHALLISSRLFALILKYIFEVDIEKKSSQRGIPGWIMQLPLDKLKHFIKGYHDGDGYHADSARKNRIIFHTSSKELANDVSMIMLRFGILASIFEIDLKQMKKYKKSWSRHYRVEAAGLSSNNILDLENIKQKLNAPVWNDLVFANVKSVEKKPIASDTKVYDFEVSSSEGEYQNFLGGFGGVCCHNSDHQILLLDKVSEMIKEGEPIKLMIIDSLTAHFRAEFTGRGQLADRQQKLNRYIHQLMKLAETYNLAVYVTNQVMANPAQMFGDPTTAIGGHIVGHACLTGDSLIQLADGDIIEIKDMQKNKVVCSDFNELNIGKSDSEKVFVNPEVKDIYNIRTNCQINCSELHRFFTIDNFGIVEKEAKELRKGDFVAQIANLDFDGEERPIQEFKIRKIGKLTKESSGLVKSKLIGKAIERKELCKEIGITQRQFRRVVNQEYPTSFDVLDSLQNYFGNEQILEIVPVFTNKHHNINIPQLLTPKLAQIFGYFVGDGNLENRGLRFRDARIEVLQTYSQLFKEIFNVNGNISKVSSKNCFSLNINSAEIKELFKSMLPIIFNEVAKSKKEVVLSFIKGFVDAEGHINKKRSHITAAQKNPLVLRHLQMLLLRGGIRSTIKFGIGSKKISILRISDKDIEGYLQIGFSASDKQRRLIECIQGIKKTYSYEMMPVKRDELASLMRGCGLKPYKMIKSRPKSYKWLSRKELENSFKELINCRINDRQIKQKIEFISKLLNSDIRFERIREINIDKNNGQVLYDFSVPNAENYVANGFIVHNSTYRLYLRRGKKDSRVAKLIDSPNLPDNECIFFVSEAGVVDGKEE